MFAVIPHQQQLFRSEVVSQRVRNRSIGLLTHAQGRRDHLRHQSRLGQGRQLHQPYAVCVILQHFSSHVQGESRLAATANPGKREQASSGEQAFDFHDNVVPPDETCQLER